MKEKVQEFFSKQSKKLSKKSETRQLKMPKKHQLGMAKK